MASTQDDFKNTKRELKKNLREIEDQIRSFDDIHEFRKFIFFSSQSMNSNPFYEIRTNLKSNGQDQEAENDLRDPIPNNAEKV